MRAVSCLIFHDWCFVFSFGAGLSLWVFWNLSLWYCYALSMVFFFLCLSLVLSFFCSLPSACSLVPRFFVCLFLSTPSVSSLFRHFKRMCQSVFLLFLSSFRTPLPPVSSTVLVSQAPSPVSLDSLFLKYLVSPWPCNSRFSSYYQEWSLGQMSHASLTFYLFSKMTWFWDPTSLWLTIL